MKSKLIGYKINQYELYLPKGYNQDDIDVFYYYDIGQLDYKKNLIRTYNVFSNMDVDVDIDIDKVVKQLAIENRDKIIKNKNKDKLGVKSLEITHLIDAAGYPLRNTFLADCGVYLKHLYKIVEIEELE